MTALVYIARAGQHLIGLVLNRYVYEASGDSNAADHYGIGHIPGQLWERLAEADEQMHGKPRTLTYSQFWSRGPQLVHGGWPETWRRYVDGVLESRRPAMLARRA